MKLLIAISLLLIEFTTLANMASPLRRGSESASAFTSQYADIIKEELKLTIANDFKTADYEIVYHITVQESGNQIPLLFYAKDYDSQFRIWVDGVEVPWFETISGGYEPHKDSIYEDFAQFYGEDDNGGRKKVLLEGKAFGYYVALYDMIYFETDLSKGRHTIEVRYTARCWEDQSDWVMDYSFRYALSPAKQWRSFKRLELAIDAGKYADSITINLPDPDTIAENGCLFWTFDELPADYIKIDFKPSASAWAQRLINWGPAGLTYLLVVPLILIHLLWCWWYRKQNRDTRFSWAVLVGAIVIPIIGVIWNMYSWEFIDNQIGEHASRFHGYTFLVVLVLPIVMPGYWLVLFGLDRGYRSYLLNKYSTMERTILPPDEDPWIPGDD